MSYALAATALVMGLAGGPHCTAMCGAACAGLARGSERRRLAQLTFQAGRLVGYSAIGAAAGQGVESLAWLSSYTGVLAPAVTFFHLAVLGWGLMLLVLARQPEWAGAAGRNVWGKVRPLVKTRRGLFAAGALWAFMPCGLLYSAVMVAALSGGPVEGAIAMALFAAGSGLWLTLAPGTFSKMRDTVNRLRQDMGTRLSGLLLVAAAVFALWMDLAHRIAVWCAG